MKTNKEAMKSAMDRRLSFLDELPSCRASVQQRIAQEETPVMKKKISLGVVFAIVLVCLSAIGVATGFLLSPKADAARIADAALEEKYGVTLKMQTFFYRDEEDIGYGTVRVTYTGKDALKPVLGVYTADIKDGKAVITWNYDGMNTENGYEADAWGAAQLEQMLKDNSATGDMGLFMPYVEAAAKRLETDTEESEEWKEEDVIAYYENLETEKTEAMNARKLPENEMQTIAKEAIIARYELTDEQAAMLELFVQPYADQENAFYWMINGQPCFEVQYFLTQNPDHPENFVEKDGTYGAAVNVETGVIERLIYESGLGGEG